MNKTFTNINEIPVPTWSWLRVNDATLRIPPTTGIKTKPNVKITGEFKGVKGFDKSQLMDFNGKADEKIPLKVAEYITDNVNTGYNITIGKGETLLQPVEITHTLTGDNIVDYHLIHGEENSTGTIVLDYKSTGEKGFRGGILQVRAEKGSNLTIIKVQNLGEDDDNVDFTTVFAEEDAQVNIIIAEIGARQTIGNCNIHLVGERANVTLDSIYGGGKGEEIDLNYRSVHHGKKSVSHINSIGILTGDCRKIFRGTVDFLSGCSGSDGKEEEKTILLSPHVKNLSVPLLLCGEDDVSGAHAASCGRIDERKFFYLMSRGFSKEQAKEILIDGDIVPILDKIPLDNLREEIFHRIHKLIK